MQYNYSLLETLINTLNVTKQCLSSLIRNHKPTICFELLLCFQSVIPLWKELEYYKEFQRDLRKNLGEDKANQVLSEALYIISVGTNDFLQNYHVVPERTSESSVKDYHQYLLGIADDFITKLYQLGARKISVAGLPPLGCFPLERTTNIMFGSGCVEECNNLAKDLNEKLKVLLAQLNYKLAGIRLVFTNTYDILSNIIHNPGSLGKLTFLPMLVIKNQNHNI